MRFVGMAGRDGVAEMQMFVDNLGVGGFTHVVDEDGSIWERFGVRSQPSFVFIDDDGATAVHNGPLNSTGLRVRIEELLAS